MRWIALLLVIAALGYWYCNSQPSTSTSDVVEQPKPAPPPPTPPPAPAPPPVAPVAQDTSPLAPPPKLDIGGSLSADPKDQNHLSIDAVKKDDAH